MAIVRKETRWGHGYWLDGKYTQGVTTLINQGVAKPFLIDWAARMVAEYTADNLEAVWGMRSMDRQSIVDALKSKHETVKRAAGLRGTEIHALGHALLMGEEVSVPAEQQADVDAYVRWLDDWQVVPVMAETVCASRGKVPYCGTWDAVVDIPDCPRTIVDLKTGKRPYAETALQLAAYGFSDSYVVGPADGKSAETPTAALGIGAALIVHIHDGEAQAVPVAYNREVFHTFLRIAWAGRDAKKVVPGLMAEAPVSLSDWQQLQEERGTA